MGAGKDANEKRLIDANNLLERILSLTLTVTGLRNGQGVLLELLNKYRNGILQLVNEQPTVDAVEVVRCKNCIYRHTRYACQGRSMDFYCASGKRVSGMEVK